jgi:hypothetical protein
MRSEQTVSKKTLVGSSPYASDCKLLVSRAGSDRSMQHPAGHLIWQYVSSGPSFGVAVRFYLNRTPFLRFWFADAS